LYNPDGGRNMAFTLYMEERAATVNSLVHGMDAVLKLLVSDAITPHLKRVVETRRGR
jgi:hypothetical protein